MTNSRDAKTAGFKALQDTLREIVGSGVAHADLAEMLAMFAGSYGCQHDLPRLISILTEKYDEHEPPEIPPGPAL